jgi:3-deoxy-D-manno-octulosonic-acid transferase
MSIVYSAILSIFELALSFYGLLNERIKQWNIDRDDHLHNIKAIRESAGERPIIWMHCASLGEFEQGIPVIKALREKKPNNYFLLSFFSPSGYEQKKNSKDVDQVIYLPIDTLSNANKIVKELCPLLFIGVKYEFWWNLLRALKRNKVKIIFVSVLVKSNFYFLKKYLPFHTWLQDIDMIFTQDDVSEALIKETGHMRVITTGDTRSVSVMQRLQNIQKVKSIEPFLSIQKPVIIYGSIYKSDLAIITKTINNKSYFHIIVPHHVNSENVNEILETVETDFVVFSKLDDTKITADGIIIDTIGKLFDLYQYADLVYIGGGFEQSIHNTLEPAAYGLPIAFGPKNDLFIEAKQFQELGIAMEVNNEVQFSQFLEASLSKGKRAEISKLSNEYFLKNKDAVNHIVGALDI